MCPASNISVALEMQISQSFILNDNRPDYSETADNHCHKIHDADICDCD